MPDATVTVQFEFEFGFLNGSTQYFTAQDGRDRIAADDARVRLEIHHDEATVEEIIVTRSALAYMRTTKRTVTVEPTLEDQIDAAIIAHG